MLYQSLTAIPAKRHGFTEWQRGRESYAVWVLRFDNNPALQAKFTAARGHLSEYLLEPYPRQAHVTLFVCGFLVAQPRYNDDFSAAQLKTQIRALKNAHFQPFEIEVGNLSSFASAPFLEVQDPDGGIPRLRDVLSCGSNEFRTTPYRPHLTLGLYAAAFPSERILSQMAGFSSPPVRHQVEQITLATYRAGELGGELSCRYNFRF